MFGKIIAVTNRKLCDGDFLTQVEKICELQPKALVLREKDLPEPSYIQLASKVMAICEKHGVDFVAHSFVNAAKILGCKKIHLPLNILRNEKLDDFESVGTSCHSFDEITEAESLGASYVFLGNIFETDCKKGLEGKGLEFLKKACSLSSIPVYAIGGVTLERLTEILEAGAKGGCMMSGILRVSQNEL